MHTTTILVINCGSSSVKMALLVMPEERMIAHGMAEQLNSDDASWSWAVGNDQRGERVPMNHESAIVTLLAALRESLPDMVVAAVGHRMVHGGEQFSEPTRLNPTSIAQIESIAHLAPLHNPVNILGIRAAMSHLPHLPHVGVFDTAFHHTLPPHAYLYAVPLAWYQDFGVRRYGFHGTSHHYVAQQAAQSIGIALHDCNLLTVHLGNGCSATAIKNGASVDTTMGLTPLEGLVMGTRSGDVDPSLPAFIAQRSGMSLDEITACLNQQSGLLGLSQLSNDMRTLWDAAEGGHHDAAQAIDVFCHRLARALGGLSTSLERIDAIVFTGGIGEHAAAIRQQTVARLALFGILIDPTRNMQHGQQTAGIISTDESAFPVLVIATNEEAMIARYTHQLMEYSHE
ncbi:MAG: acetate kinase [Mariprofundaceae bacterium]|nr:acetate kinase [Mariprofundaceae bacterium]